MHYHAEIFLENLIDVHKQITEILAPFDKNLEIEQYELDGEKYWCNPNSFWDWYQIGGRWTGVHTDYDPIEDPRNIEECSICGGTGYCDDIFVRGICNACGEYDEENGCWTHGKLGPGKRIKWPSQYASYSGDVIPVAEVKEDLSCYTLIIRDEVFHQRIWSDGKIKQTKFSGNVLEQLRATGVDNGYLVTVDYHC